MCNKRKSSVQALGITGFFLNRGCVTFALLRRNALQKLLFFFLPLLEETSKLRFPKSRKALTHLGKYFSVADVTRNAHIPQVLSTASCGGCTKVQSSQSPVRHPWCRLCEFRFCITASRSKAVGLGPYPYAGGESCENEQRSSLRIPFMVAGSSCHHEWRKEPLKRTSQQKETNMRRTR